MLASGSRLGPYEIVAPLGAGGMGEVYRARDTRLDRTIAIKVLPAEVADDPDRMKRFEGEARAASRLNHPNVVTIHDIGRDHDVTYIAMELVDGETLRERLASGSLSTRESLALSTQLAEGLARAHEEGIIHRDLKPENIMLTRDGRVKILDFGLAKFTSDRSGDHDSRAATAALSRTAEGTVLGTIGYMAPEQARGLPASERSDLFSFGAILFEMLTGRRVFSGESAVAILSEIVGSGPVDLTALPSGLPGPLVAVLRRCLEKDSSRRLSSAHDLALELRDLASGPGPRSARTSPRRKKAIDSMAVLPLINASGDAANDYLSDGVTESIIHALSQLPKLQVMAGSTVFRFKGRDPLEAARELGVRAVLTGKLSRSSDSLRVQAELVETATGFRLWGEVYDRRMSDLLAVEDEIASEICERLRFKLAGAERRRVARQPTRDPEAYQAFLKGRFFWNKWTMENLRTSIEFYERAIEIDPGYALAWAGIADSYAVLGGIKAVPPAESFPKAKAAAQRALALDPALADAHASLGYVQRLFDWDWGSAERSFREAVRLNPSYATGHRWYGQFLSGLGRHNEALAEVMQAVDLDPLSIIIHTSVGDVLFYARRYGPAIEYYRKGLEMNPEFLAVHSDLARALEFSGEIDAAIGEYEKAIRLAGRSDADPSIGLANALAVAGRRSEALAVLDTLQTGRAERYVSPWGLASIYARLNEEGQALDWLERAYAERDSTLVWLKVHPRFDSLRNHPRFAALLKKMNLDG
jgi:serine/threonine protein kinase/tetratricopeptide (TPR) repeat protein